MPRGKAIDLSWQGIARPGLPWVSNKTWVMQQVQGSRLYFHWWALLIGCVSWCSTHMESVEVVGENAVTEVWRVAAAFWKLVFGLVKQGLHLCYIGYVAPFLRFAKLSCSAEVEKPNLFAGQLLNLTDYFFRSVTCRMWHLSSRKYGKRVFQGRFIVSIGEQTWRNISDSVVWSRSERSWIQIWIILGATWQVRRMYPREWISTSVRRGRLRSDSTNNTNRVLTVAWPRWRSGIRDV